MTSSSGTKPGASLDRPATPGQQRRHLDPGEVLAAGARRRRTTTARFSDSPEMYGNGWAGSTASGVSTG